MSKLVKLELESGHNQTLTVPDEYKVHDSLIDTASPGAWVIIPTETGGHFAVRAGTILSLAVESADVVR